MAQAVSAPSPTAARTGLLARITTWLTNVAEAQARPLRREINELHAKTDRELEDMGIRRDEIEMRVLGSLSLM